MQTSKSQRWSCSVSVLVSDRRYKSSEETITNTRNSNLLILACSFGSWNNPEGPEEFGCIPVACDHLHMDSSSAQNLHSTTQGSLFGRQPHRWRNPHLNTWEQRAGQHTRVYLICQPCPWQGPRESGHDAVPYFPRTPCPNRIWGFWNFSHQS